MKVLLTFSNSLTAVKLFFYKSIYGRAYAHLYGLDVALNILAQCKTTPLDSIFQSPEADNDIRRAFYQLQHDGFATISQHSIAITEKGVVFAANGGYLAKQLRARLTTASIVASIVAASASILAVIIAH